jgi:hypothetical protein
MRRARLIDHDNISGHALQPVIPDADADIRSRNDPKWRACQKVNARSVGRNDLFTKMVTAVTFLGHLNSQEVGKESNGPV